MDLLVLVNALLTLNIRVSVQKADALYKAMGIPALVSSLDYYRAECKRLTDQNESLRSTQDEDLARLRAKLTGSARTDLVETALASPAIIDLVANSKRIEAIKELRIVTGCHLREAKDAIDDERVTMRAQLPQWERDLLY